MSNIVVTMFTVQQFLCEIHVDPINGYSYNYNTLKAACATPYKGMSGALWKGNHLSEHGCPLAGTTGHAY